MQFSEIPLGITAIYLTADDLEALQCGIPFTEPVLGVLVVPEGASVRTPSWAHNRVPVTAQQLRDLEVSTDALALSEAVAVAVWRG